MVKRHLYCQELVREIGFHLSIAMITELPSPKITFAKRSVWKPAESNDIDTLVGGEANFNLVMAQLRIPKLAEGGLPLRICLLRGDT